MVVPNTDHHVGGSNSSSSSSSSSSSNTNRFGLNVEQTYIASVVGTYWFVSISMVYVNKLLMSSEQINMSIPAPLFVTWFQCVITALICYVCGEVAHTKLNSHYDKLPSDINDTSLSSSSSSSSKANSFWLQFPRAEYKIGTAQRVFPLSIVFVGMITFNNLCLKWVAVSFYNVARSLTIVFNAVLSTMLLQQKHTSIVISCLTFVIFGFFIGSSGEINFSLKGTIAGVCSSLFVSLNAIYTKKILPAVDNDHWKLTYYNNINACIMFIPLMIVFEHNPISDAIFQQFITFYFWIAMLIAGFFGFSIGIVTVLQIKATSPLSHNISGTAKAAVQSLLAFYIWGNPWTIQGIAGIFITLGGSLAYTLVKMNESKPSSAKHESSSSSSSIQQSSSSGAVTSSSSNDVELNKRSTSNKD